MMVFLLNRLIVKFEHFNEVLVRNIICTDFIALDETREML